MEFDKINELKKAQDLGTNAPWTLDPAAHLRAPAPQTLAEGIARGRHLHAIAVQDAIVASGRAIGRALRKVVGAGRASRRLIPRVPAGAHGPEAVNFDCAHGRPC